MRKTALIIVLAAVALSQPIAGAASASTTAATTLQVPFPCGEKWYGKNYSGGGHEHNGYAIDFNISPTDGNGDQGRPVAAAAPGVVVRSVYETGNGFGNVVVIRHGDGTTTLYAHLKSRAVAVNASVTQGQIIGAVGRTSAKYKMASHLHFEHRTASGGGKAVSFNGTPYTYNGKYNPIFSKNGDCGGGKDDPVTPPPPVTNPYTPEQVCGPGFGKVDSERLGSAGTVYLLYKSATGENCVVSMRADAKGKAAMSSYLEVNGKRLGDQGSFTYYAGPVRAKAKGICVKWGGSIGSAKYDSPLEHCGR